MSLGPSAYLVTKWFDATFNNTSFVVAQAYLKLHLADPGAAGATAPATYTTRHAVSMGAPVSAGGVVTVSNDTQLQIVGLTATGSEDATHYSLWDALTVGNFLGSGLIVANAYTGGDTLTFAIGDIDIALNVAA
jgi:hypothetical protein